MVKVSVIIPVYNSNPEYFNQALNSSLSQTIENIEIIIIDDGSTDNDIQNLLKDTKELDKRIKIISKPHQGSGLARNLGIALSNGETISFLDSDDYYPKDTTLETLYNAQKEHRLHISGGIPQELKQDGTLSTPYFNYGNLNDYFSDKEVSYYDYQFPWWYWCYLYNSEFIKSNNFYLPPYLRYQDPIWFVKVLNTAKNFWAISEPTYVHRDRKSLHTLDKNLFEHHIKGIDALLRYSDKENLLKLHKLLRDVFMSYDLELINKSPCLTQEDKLRFIEIIKSSINNEKLKQRRG